MITTSRHTNPLPPLQIGDHTLPVPIIQGGMGVRVSAHGLAAAVANEGGVGLIATVALSLASKHYKKGKDYYKANVKALEDEFDLARKISPNGLIGTNCMVAIKDFETMVKTSIACEADMIVCGAGLPLRLPEYASARPKTALLPIVSSLRAAKLLTKRWLKLYKRRPDAFVFEDPNTAGGHLGVSRDELFKPVHSADSVVPQLAEWSKKEYNDEIPIITAGGIWDRKDIDHAFDLGAKGVQMASRFLCTHECDAHENFKNSFLTATPDDIVIVDSPAGLPGRALQTPFTKTLFSDGEVDKKCFATCLDHCSCREEDITFCIARALHNSQQGRKDDGLIFTGTNAVRHDRIMHVREIFDEIQNGESAPN
ncbi:MAG: nitronate monooxygenase [Magnetococcales bacterium]|nr:nitronate monooxygenase [Magnetococcales bacterium]